MIFRVQHRQMCAYGRVRYGIVAPTCLAPPENPFRLPRISLPPLQEVITKSEETDFQVLVPVTSIEAHGFPLISNTFWGMLSRKGQCKFAFIRYGSDGSVGDLAQCYIGSPACARELQGL